MELNLQDILTSITSVIYVILIIFYFKFLKPFEVKITSLEKQVLVLETKDVEIQELKNEIRLLRTELGDIKKIMMSNNKGNS